MMPFVILLLMGAGAYLFWHSNKKDLMKSEAMLELYEEQLEEELLKLKEEIALRKAANKEEREAIRM